MKKYFWREKNADLQIGKYEVIVPTKEQLFDELIKKLHEKVEMIDVIFDKEKRQQYLQTKGKDTSVNVPESVIQQKIGTRVIVDYMQLLIDICLAKNAELNKSKSYKLKKDEIKNYIIEALFAIKEKFEDSVSKIYGATICLAKILKLKISDLENERQKVENKEGTFYKGKFVTIWKN